MLYISLRAWWQSINICQKFSLTNKTSVSLFLKGSPQVMFKAKDPKVPQNKQSLHYLYIFPCKYYVVYIPHHVLLQTSSFWGPCTFAVLDNAQHTQMCGHASWLRGTQRQLGREMWIYETGWHCYAEVRRSPDVVIPDIGIGMPTFFI